ncbi:mammaglobin-A-like isoform X1 [Ochotona princeps]|uniref:mammaglobin-A-like isoform X1 n=1 Tax=Ochotona princeps TaxID=9978 RepID=UPI0027155D80|nr:mammaglobin-A-like isoform X1 [Ochotona princeps]
MKLVVVLMLAALPLYCLAGSGCQLLEDVLAKGADPETSVEEYVDFMSEFLDNDKEREVAAGLKQCFLRQSNETLANVMVLENAIFDSLLCAPF